MTFGQYAIDEDAEQEVAVCYREFRMTIGQMVEQFGEDKCSTSVVNQYRRGNFEDYRVICHAIEPRAQADRDPGKIASLNKRWSSCYFEFSGGKGGKNSQLPNTFLSEGGYDSFPILAPRWDTSGGDVYGNAPGHQCLGDVITLQQQTKRKGMAIDYKNKPPTQGPGKLHELDQRPGGHTELTGDKKIEPVFDARYLDLNDLREDLAEIRERINRGMLAFVFLLQAQNPQDITALQSQFIEQEKMTLLGPAAERIENEILKRLVDLTFDAMLEAGEVPPWPEELEGMDLVVDIPVAACPSATCRRCECRRPRPDEGAEPHGDAPGSGRHARRGRPHPPVRGQGRRQPRADSSARGPGTYSPAACTGAGCAGTDGSPTRRHASREDRGRSRAD